MEQQQHRLNKDKQHELGGRLRELFGLPPKLVSMLKYQIKFVNENPRIRMLSPEIIQKMIISLFATEYFPVVSRNIRIDKFNQSVIMGGVAFNLNVPGKMPFLKLDTDDIDLKIYTTDINYLEKNEKAMYRVLSVLRFSVIIICMYLKQILELIKKFTTSYLPQNKQHSKHHTNKFPNKFPNKRTKQKQLGGSVKKTRVSKKVINKGILNEYKIIVLLKKKNENNVNETIDKLELTEMTYSDIFNKIMNSIDDVDLLITNKIGYNMIYGNVIKPGKFRMITFSDTKVIYPNIEHPAFYSYYFMNNKREIGKTIDQLIHQKIHIDKIMETNICGNNCKYISINTLLIDTTLMLSYAELLAYEKLENNGKVLVPVGFLYKYYKYLIKYVRLFVIKKYNNGTLNDKFLNSAKKLWTYSLDNLKNTTSQISETDELNISYKKLLNNFHQNLFINKTLLTDYPELKEAIDEYSMIVYYINHSRALFKEIDSKSKNMGESIESITIQMAEQELSKSTSKMHDGGAKSSNSRKSITLLDDVSYNDIELDNPITKQKINKKTIMNKINKLINDEITILDTIETHISKSKL
jgi:hypothetical protein